MASRSLDDLHPDLKPLAEQFLATAKMRGIDALITCTSRSDEEQDALYAQGRTMKGHIVTNARAGQSAHNFRMNDIPASRAFDCVPLIAGKPMWDAEHPAWQTLGQIGEELGLQWAGHWTSFKELPHFQLS